MKPEEALKNIDYLKNIVDKTRFHAATGYPYFILWGIIWIIGYLGSLHTELAYQIWPIICIIGCIISVIISIRINKKYPKSKPLFLKKITYVSIVLAVATGLLFTVLINQNYYKILNSYWPFQIGIIYIVVGILAGKEFIKIGSWITAVAIISVFMSTPLQEIWLALAGGGALIITGIILAKQVKKNE